MITTLYRTPVRSSTSVSFDGVNVVLLRPAVTARPSGEPWEVRTWLGHLCRGPPRRLRLGRFSLRNRPTSVPLAPRQGNLRHVDIATVEDTLGSVHWDVDNCPVAMELNEPAALEGPQEARAAGIVEGPPGRTTEQAHRIPA